MNETKREEEKQLAAHCGRHRPDHCTVYRGQDDLRHAGAGRTPPERLNPEAFASQSQSQSQEQPAGDGQADQGPAFCPFCGEEMTDSFQWGQFCPFWWRKGGAVT